MHATSTEQPGIGPQRGNHNPAEVDTDSGLGEHLFVARQPILDRGGEIHAYEILYRRGPVLCSEIIDGNQATSQLLVAAFLEFGLADLTKERPAFINITPDLLAGNALHTLPTDKVVLEILESISPHDHAALRQLSKLKALGYTIALDDFVLSDENRNLLAFADIVKVDIRAQTAQQVANQVEQLRCHPVKLVAEKVETRQEFDRCLELGFDYFQGYFFLRPQIMTKKRLPSCRTSALRILAAINDRNTTLNTLGSIVKQDVTLSYKVLKYINSPLCGFGGAIASIQHAILLIGFTRLQELANLVVLSGIDDKP